MYERVCWLLNGKIKNTSFFRRLWEQFDLQMMVLPGFVLILVFSYIPMYGAVMAFQNFRLGDAIGFSEWVGLKNFIDFFKDPRFFLVMRNTVGMSIMRLIISFPIPIIFAVLLNELRAVRFKKLIQTVSYLPHFVSWVFVSSLVMVNILGYDGGAVNSILLSLGVIKEPILFMGEPGYFWGIVILSEIWKGTGWSAIIYFAAMSAISPELYEAADIDGATRMGKIIHITLPSIQSTIVILLIMQIANLLNSGFEQIMLFTNNLNNRVLSDVSSVIDTYVLEVGIRQARFSYATAIGLFRSVAAVILLWLANTTSKRLTENSLF